MSIQSTIEGQITTANDWASSAREAATTALDSLASVDIPSITVGAIPFTPITIVTPESATEPASITLDTAPEIEELVEVEQPDRPDTPTVTLGSILSLTIPDLPTIEFPTLSFTSPTYSITSPTNWGFDVSDILISDDPFIKAAIDRLTSNIEDGGTGLSEAVEADIWARGLEREEQQLQDSTDKATQMWAKKGWSLPDGLLAHSLSEIQKDYMNRKIDRSREIAIKQAELEQSNLFKSLEITVGLASALINQLIRYEELVLRSQEDIAKFANEYIDIQIKTYMSLVEAYKAEASVYESQVRASLAKVEVYKAQIEGQKLIGEVNKQTIEIYAEQIKATSLLIERYKAEVEAMTAALGAEKVKIEANKIQLDAWAKEADVKIAEYAGKVEVFKAVAQQNISQASLQATQEEANVRTTLAATELSIKAIEISNRSLQYAAQVRVEAAKGVAAAAASMAAGAMAGVTANAGMSYQEEKSIED